ncbi:type 2 isopentenyl-diphosphate Delta-isomerase [Acidaminococcus sp.]|uniref:type 2 isopentenyl-diphosphate Delta-isomerase n=1 Tax=Acidaminococcus sp. TaxID=1872103 RepID=UPI003AB3D694
MKSRESRKLNHIRYALCIGDGPCASGFSDVHLLHHCLSGICRDEVELTCLLPGLPALTHPIIINAITGGADSVAKINESLAVVARETGSAMAVGSQFGAVRTGFHRDSYTIVRKCNPKGLIFANLSAFASVEQGKAAVDMICADALQIHLNPAQELAMEEGDRDFSKCLSHIEAMVQGVGVPVIVKETGCGMAQKEAQALLDVGVTVLDIGGAGGTNFPAIEHQRYPEGNEELAEWGIPTVISLLSVVEAAGWGNGVIASGGIRSALDVVKAQVLGASAVAMAGNLLQKLQQEGIEETIHFLRQLLKKVRDFYTLLGCRTYQDLQEAQFYLTGETAQAVSWLRKHDQNE